jgi:hypothetical protein
MCRLLYVAADTRPTAGVAGIGPESTGADRCRHYWLPGRSLVRLTASAMVSQVRRRSIAAVRRALR